MEFRGAVMGVVNAFLVLTSLSAACAGDYVKTKRALIRAVEKQAEMSEKMDLLKAELEIADRADSGGHGSHSSGAGSGGGFGGGVGSFTNSLRDRLSSATNAFSVGSPASKPPVQTLERAPED